MPVVDPAAEPSPLPEAVRGARGVGRLRLHPVAAWRGNAVLGRWLARRRRPSTVDDGNVWRLGEDKRHQFLDEEEASRTRRCGGTDRLYERTACLPGGFSGGRHKEEASG